MAKYPHGTAFSIQVGRNLTLQGVGIAMVAVMGFGVLAWPLFLAWTLGSLTVAISEQHVLRRIVGSDATSKLAVLWAPTLRFMSTTLYAAAALALILRRLDRADGAPARGGHGKPG